MVQSLTSAYLLSQDGTQYEVLRKAHYEVDIQGISTLLLAQDVNLPKYELESVEVFHYNDRTKVPSRPNPSDIRIDLLDATNPNVVQELWDWWKQIYDPATGRMGYASEYKRQGKIMLYDIGEQLIRTWTCTGLWPKTTPTPDEAYSYEAGHDVVKIAMVLSCDRATLDGRTAASLI